MDNKTTDTNENTPTAPMHKADRYYKLGVNYAGKRNFKLAVAAFRKAIILMHDYPGVHYELGMALKELGIINEAKHELACEIGINPANKDAHDKLALVCFNDENYTEAIDYLKKAIEAHPDYCDFYYNVSRCYYELKQYEKALDYALTAVEKDQYSANRHYNLGCVYFMLKRYIDAINEFEVSIMLNRRSKCSYNWLRDCYMEIEKPDKAVLLYKSAISIDPYWAYMQIGALYEYTDQYMKAELAYMNALKVKPNDCHAYTHLAEMYENTGCYTEARIVREKIITIRPKDPGDCEFIGLSFMRLDRYEEALGYLLAASKHDPDCTELYLFVARCHLEMGNKDMANAICETLKDIDEEVERELLEICSGY
jgi:tetratricopeptide (TPR) repeat protein